MFVLFILFSPSLGLSQHKSKPSKPKETLLYPKKKILILDVSDLSTDNSHSSLSKAIPRILKTQLESERVMRDFSSKERYYFYTRKEIRQAMTKGKIKKEDLSNPEKVIHLGWLLKADIVILSSYSVTGDKARIQLEVLSVKEERTVLTYTSKPLSDPYVALDLFILKHYNTMEEIPNLPPIDPSKLLILDLADESGVSNYRHLSKRLPEILKDNLLNIRDYRIVSRSDFLKVMKRRKWENSYLKDKKKALSIARELGAVVVIYGSYKKVGDTVEISILVVDTKTGKILYRHKGDNTVGQKEMNQLTRNFIAGERKRPKSVFKSMPEPLPIPPRLGIKIGYPFIFGNLGDVTKAGLPYVSVSLRNPLFRTQFLYELDISYLNFKNDGTVFTFINSIPVGTNSQSHAFPVTFSVLYPLSLSKAFSLNLKIGLGYMLTYTTSSQVENGFSSFLIGKPGFELEYRLSPSASIILENTLLMAVEARDFDITFFYIPNVGVSFDF